MESRGSRESLLSDGNDVADYVMVNNTASRRPDDDGFMVALKMSQIQRVSEQSVTSFVPCR